MQFVIQNRFSMLARQVAVCQMSNGFYSMLARLRHRNWFVVVAGDFFWCQKPGIQCVRLRWAANVRNWSRICHFVCCLLHEAPTGSAHTVTVSMALLNHWNCEQKQNFKCTIEYERTMSMTNNSSMLNKAVKNSFLIDRLQCISLVRLWIISTPLVLPFLAP